MKFNVKLLFFLYRSKVNARKQAPIYGRITINKIQRHFSTGFFINLAHWDSKHHKVKNTSNLADSINNYLSAIEQKVIELALKYQVSSKQFSADDFMNELFNRRNQTLESLLTVFQKHNEELKNLVGKSYTQATLVKFEGIYRQVYDFIKSQYQKEDILLSNLKLKFLLDFQQFLFVEKILKQVSINKTIQRIRKIIKYAIAHEYLEKDPFLLFKSKKINLDVVFLSTEELRILEYYSLESQKLTQVKDCFVFCCYTGLGYREMSELNQSNIVVGIDGNDWIKMTRQKTSKPLLIPILPQAAQILEKYSSRDTKDKLLPIISNQRFNVYLKEIAAEIGILKKLTHHIARKTFASTVLLYNDVPIEIVSELLGHSDIKTTQQYYAKVANRKLSDHMGRVADKLK
jgi:integrase/recombinase XerD